MVYHYSIEVKFDFGNHPKKKKKMSTTMFCLGLFCGWCCREVDVHEYAYFKAVSEHYNMQ